MNDIPPLDSPTLAYHHEHDTRIIRLEVQMSNVNVTLESMQERMDQLRAALQHDSDMQDARLQHNCDALRASLKHITDAQQSIWEALQREIHRLDNKIDSMNRWVMGLLFTYLVATAALFARPYLNI